MISREPPYLQYLFSKAVRNGVPLSGTFELTSRCNFNCKMCYIHNSNNDELKKKELTAQQWKDIALCAQKAGMLILLITGGEPLLRPDFSEIYTYCKNLGFEIAVNTNGSLITDEIIELFKKYRPSRVSISLYGTSDETYKEVTCKTGYYEKVTENILKLKSAGIQVKISIVVSSYNRDDIASIYQFAKENQIPTETSCYLFPSARLGQNTDRPSAIEAAENMVTGDKCYYGKRYHERKEVLSKIEENKKEQAESGLHIRCRAGRAAMWISYDGTMLPCGMMVEPKASVLENGFNNAWETIKEEAKKIILPVECTNCEYSSVCDSCAASCYAETGRFDGLPQYLCQKAHEYVRLSKKELEI